MWQICINIVLIVLILVQFHYIYVLSEAYHDILKEHYRLSGSLGILLDMVDVVRNDILEHMFSKSNEPFCEVDSIYTDIGNDD